MSAEHTPEPAEHGGRREPAQAATVQGLAEAIAEQIATQQAVGAAIGGSFDVDIVYKDIEYKLEVTAPVPKENDPGAWIATGTRTDTVKNTTKTFLDFYFKDQDNWKAGLGLPLPITFSNGLEIKHLYGEFRMGTVPTVEGEPELEA